MECSRPSPLGIWRFVDSEYPSRERPSIAEFAAAISVAAATAPIAYLRASASPCGCRRVTIPITGSFRKRCPSAVYVPCIGNAVTATTAMPTYATSTSTVPLATSRRSALREARTSPARPDADSTLVNAIVVIVSAKIRPDQVGALPRWIEVLIVCTSKNCTRPSTITSSSSTSAPTTTTPMRSPRRALKPRTLLNTTNAMIASVSTSDSGLLPSGRQKTFRYWLAA